MSDDLDLYIEERTKENKRLKYDLAEEEEELELVIENRLVQQTRAC
ncbi:hypothetical protein XNA1_3820002 [Xenorhabdus nematophila str. Anatoliense]|nr:hypothetical protein XNA1_3820002 [Xenorhabdus nematophila str. Anatoliense]